MSHTRGMTWTVEDRGPYVLVRTAGTFDVTDHFAMVRDVVSQPFWRPGRDAFFDHRALTFDGSGYVAMTVAASTHRGFDDEIGPGRAAILMNSDADFAVVRIFDALTGENVQAEFRLFTDAGDAEAWILSERRPKAPEP